MPPTDHDLLLKRDLGAAEMITDDDIDSDASHEVRQVRRQRARFRTKAAAVFIGCIGISALAYICVVKSKRRAQAVTSQSSIFERLTVADETKADKQCSTYPACSGLAGNCCPTDEGDFLECCGLHFDFTSVAQPASSLPKPPAAGNASALGSDTDLGTMELPPPPSGVCNCPDHQGKFDPCCPNARGAECSSYPACVLKGLTSGSCCPNHAGDYLECCKGGLITAPHAPFEYAICNKHPACMDAGYISGACCPDAAGTYLPCCGYQLNYNRGGTGDTVDRGEFQSA